MAAATSASRASMRPKRGVAAFAGLCCSVLMGLETAHSPEKLRIRTAGPRFRPRSENALAMPNGAMPGRSTHRHSFVGTVRAADGLHNLRWQTEAHVLRHHFHFFNVLKAVLAQIIHHILNQHLGRRGPGRNGNVVD